MVQAEWTSRTYVLEPHHHRDSKVRRGLLHEFKVVRPYGTFSIYIVKGETRSVGCLCNSSGWFKHIELHQTYSNHNTTEIARCGEVCHMSSGWFDCTEPSLSISLQVRGCSSRSNLTELTWNTTSQGVKQHEFRVVRLYHSFSIYIIAGETRCAGFLCSSSGWFKHIKPNKQHEWIQNWTPLAVDNGEYDPLRAESIDGTDTTLYDHGIILTTMVSSEQWMQNVCVCVCVCVSTRYSGSTRNHK